MYIRGRNFCSSCTGSCCSTRKSCDKPRVRGRVGLVRNERTGALGGKNHHNTHTFKTQNKTQDGGCFCFVDVCVSYSFQDSNMPSLDLSEAGKKNTFAPQFEKSCYSPACCGGIPPLVAVRFAPHEQEEQGGRLCTIAIYV